MKIIFSIIFLFFSSLAQADLIKHYHDDRDHVHGLPTAGISHNHNGGAIGSSENKQASEGGCSPNINVTNGSSGNVTFNCKSDTPQPTSNLKKQSAESITGDWEFRYDIYRSVDSAGVIQEGSSAQKMIFRFHVSDNEIIGNLIGASSKNICDGVKIKGSLKGRTFMFNKSFTGSCCRHAQVIFKGEIQAGNQKIEGKHYPLETPPYKNCQLWWADVSARKL